MQKPTATFSDTPDPHALNRSLVVTMIITASVGVPFVQLLWGYVLMGTTTGVQTNIWKYGKAVLFSAIVVVVMMFLHAQFLMHLARPITATLTKLQARRELTRTELIGALVTSLKVPLQGALASAFTWPGTVLITIVAMWHSFMSFPKSLAALMTFGCLCAGLLVSNFQYYGFRNALLRHQKVLLAALPAHWEEPILTQVRAGLKRRLAVNLSSLLFVFMVQIAFIVSVQSVRALFFEWGVGIKHELQLQFGESTRALGDPALIDSLAHAQKTARGQWHLFSKAGEPLWQPPTEPQTLAVMQAFTRGEFDFDHLASLTPHYSDRDIALSMDNDTFGVAVRVPLVGGERVLVARSTAAAHMDLISSILGANVVVCLFALVFGILFAILSGRDMTTSLATLTSVAQGVSQGDLRRMPLVITGDELGALAMAVARMRANLESVVTDVGLAVQNLDQNSQTIAQVSEATEASSRHQVDEVERTTLQTKTFESASAHLAKSVVTLSGGVQDAQQALAHLGNAFDALDRGAEQLSETSTRTRDHAQRINSGVATATKAAEALNLEAARALQSVEAIQTIFTQASRSSQQTVAFSDAATAATEEGLRRVQDTLTGIETAQVTSRQALGVVEDLATQTEDIGKILSVLTEVADRTRLLSLNASIIAAHSGDAGRSFAVVAEEIKRLAERTTHSISEIHAIVSRVQEGARDSVRAFRRGDSQVGQGVEFARLAGRALGQIHQAVQETSAQQRVIATSLTAQLQRADEMHHFAVETARRATEVGRVLKDQEGSAHELATSAVSADEAAQSSRMAQQQGRTALQQLMGNVTRTATVASELQGEQRQHQAASTTIVEAVRTIHAAAQDNWKGAGAMLQTGRLVRDLAQRLRTSMAVFSLVGRPTEATAKRTELNEHGDHQR